MASIPGPNVPGALHRVYQTRAAAAGMSRQEYLLAELEHNAAVRIPAELVAEVEDRLRAEVPFGCARVSAFDVVRADRLSH
jgi:hypothetical protein